MAEELQKFSLKNQRIIPSNRLVNTIKNVEFFLLAIDDNDINFVDFTKSFINASSENRFCVIPDVGDDEVFLGVFDDKGKVFAVLHAEKHEEKLEIINLSGKELHCIEDRREYVEHICEILETQEYPIRLLKKQNEELVYMPNSAWERKLRSMELYKNGEGKVSAYKDFYAEIINRSEWAMNIKDELSVDIRFRDDVHSEETILQIINKSNGGKSTYLAVPLFKDQERLIIESSSKHPFLISKAEGDKIKVNYLGTSGDPEELRGIFNSCFVFNGKSKVCDVIPAKLDEDNGVIVTGKVFHRNVYRNPIKNEKLEKFSSDFVQFVKKNYFTREGDKIAERMANILSGYKPLPENKDLFEMLKKTGILKVQERTFGEFLYDLFEAIGAWFKGESLGNVIGDGKITISYSNSDAENLMKLMKDRETSKNSQVAR